MNELPNINMHPIKAQREIVVHWLESAMDYGVMGLAPADEAKTLIKQCTDRLEFLEELERIVENQELKQALRLLKRGSCWCEMAICNPMVKEHSEGCKLAQQLMGDVT